MIPLVFYHTDTVFVAAPDATSLNVAAAAEDTLDGDTDATVIIQRL